MPKKKVITQEKDTQNTPQQENERGKKIWELAPSPLGGRPRLFTSPLTLWRRFLAYCKWVDDNPWEEKFGASSLTSSAKVNTNSMRQQVRTTQRAYTLYGFCAYSGIYKWSSFKQKYYGKESACSEGDREKYEGFSTVIDAIENIVASQQIDGALSNMFNSNLVARLNGIADNVKSEVTGKDGSDLFKMPKLSAEDLRELSEINARLK